MFVDYTAPPALRRSDSLHKRVRQFAHDAQSLSRGGARAETFETIAVDIARFQYEQSPGFARLCPHGAPKSLEQIPIVPTDVFRLTRVALHPPELDQAVYQTSGTTAALSGRHAVRDLATKEELAVLQAESTLFRAHGRGIIVALAPVPDGTSSLGHMMELFMRQFDGRPLTSEPDGASFSVHEAGRWLVGPHGIDVDGLRRAARLAKHRAEPLYVLATAFAMVAALDELDGETIAVPRRTQVMITGGFKGKSRVVDEAQLRRMICSTFGIEEEQIIGEYGMTELGSQMFEQRWSHPAAAVSRDVEKQGLGSGRWWEQGAGAGIYFAPPWLRVQAIDAATYLPVAAGEVGLAHFIDLANIDSCLSIVTQDQIRQVGHGYALLGRAPQAPSRGCSLPFESYVREGAPATSGVAT